MSIATCDCVTGPHSHSHTALTQRTRGINIKYIKY